MTDINNEEKVVAEENNIHKIGFDMGNKNIKIGNDFDKIEYEFPAAYSIVNEEDYKDNIPGPEDVYVKYNENYYLVGPLGNLGITHENKGHSSVREIANMFKLVGLSKELERLETDKGEFYIVTGTPVQDHEAFVGGYEDLFLSNSKEYETIEVKTDKGTTIYNILVSDVYVTKQASVTKPLLKGVDEGHVLLRDWGGGTFDAALYINGTLDDVKTIGYSLNEALVELGHKLRGAIDIRRPDKRDNQFLTELETIVMDGTFYGTSTIKIDGNEVSLKDYTTDFFMDEINSSNRKIIDEFGLSEDMLKMIKVVNFGGGAKLLESALSKDNTFKEGQTVVPEPHFLNVKAYSTFARVREWD